MLVHWYIVHGIKSGQPRYLVPFIIIYTMLLVLEAVSFVFVVNHIVVLSYLKTVPPQTSSGYVIITAIFVFTMGVQGVMLTAVIRCRNYLEKRQIHDLEMRVAEKSKLQHPGLVIICGGGSLGVNESTVVPHTDAPPSYDCVSRSTNGNSQAPQRTVLQAEDGLI
ncbi:unnamed protein product [Nippostrongylus brasiliensis]|uniref:Palmitoyltransferase n=1 Tax=Nippostrongylus brasiliensis TaxID=27835 RepID=A0A0N4YJT8_NIPBR|nr:unnamed protein product [Nippostrongylus brasiliensis]